LPAPDLAAGAQREVAGRHDQRQVAAQHRSQLAVVRIENGAELKLLCAPAG
jgi:hypothetical protein